MQIALAVNNWKGSHPPEPRHQCPAHLCPHAQDTAPATCFSGIPSTSAAAMAAVSAPGAPRCQRLARSTCCRTGAS